MKHFNRISKILLIVVAIIGLTVGMSTITGCSNSSDDTRSAVSDKADKVKADVKDAKCGGDEVKAAVSDKVDEAKASVKDAKCGEGKCGEGKCGGDEAKAVVSDKVDEAKASVKEEAKCGEGKCG